MRGCQTYPLFATLYPAPWGPGLPLEHDYAPRIRGGPVTADPRGARKDGQR